MKKLLTSLLCVVMVMTFMPAMAFAADADALNVNRTEMTEATTELLAGVQYKLARNVELNRPLTVTASEPNGLYVKCCDR